MTCETVRELERKLDAANTLLHDKDVMNADLRMDLAVAREKRDCYKADLETCRASFKACDTEKQERIRHLESSNAEELHEMEELTNKMHRLVQNWICDQ